MLSYMTFNTETGICSTKQLRSQGFTDYQIRLFSQNERLVSIRRGWYATPSAIPEAVKAVKLGGTIGCVSACKEYGLWIPPQEKNKLHVSLPSNVPLQVTKESVCFHRSSEKPHPFLPPIGDCLHQVLKYHDGETGLILLESAFHEGALCENDCWYLIKHAPASKRQTLKFFTPGAESGSETRVRLFFQKRGVPVKIQHRISGIGRVDIRFGQSGIVECDSLAFHDKETSYYQDRWRDIRTLHEGYFTVRLSYPQIWYEWDETREYLSSLLKQRRHRNPPKPCGSTRPRARSRKSRP
ncbi:hypothetical protein FYJ63_07600 [Mobiluncus holmesii]|uniref:Transcriptional regulator, AbiEi antitoxin, Type IV TA system n=2 Tax=Mobiluncus porci TaxID=2652278 RepID=A0A7K0K3N1_9ACTO|nr:hypothetical protein [Mobiluncus porci]